MSQISFIRTTNVIFKPSLHLMRRCQMNRWLLVIFLLSYSSVGWSKPLMMECFVESSPLMKELTLGLIEDKVSFGIFKMESDVNTNSETLLMRREDGVWKGGCHRQNQMCKKGDQSVVVVKTEGGEEVKLVLDFRFLTLSLKGVTIDSKTKKKTNMDLDLKCERID
jgi:hypothetical protein